MFVVQKTLEEQAHILQTQGTGLECFRCCQSTSEDAQTSPPTHCKLTASHLLPWRVLGQQRRSGSALQSQVAGVLSGHRICRSMRWESLWLQSQQTQICPLPSCHVWTCTFPTNTDSQPAHPSPCKWSRKHHSGQSPSHLTQKHAVIHHPKV